MTNSKRKNNNAESEHIRLHALSSDSIPVYEAGERRTLANFRLAYEGVCFGNRPGQSGRRDFRFDSHAIRRLSEGLKLGTPIYRGHQSRKQIGAVVGSYLEEGESGLQSYAIARFPGGLDKDVDICSIEADLKVDRKDSQRVMGISNVTGIAVESSEKEVPGFRDAKLFEKVTFFRPDEVDIEEAEKHQPTKEDKTLDNDMEKKILEKLDSMESKIEKYRDEGRSEISNLKTSFDNQSNDSKRASWAQRLETFFPDDITKGQREYLQVRFSDTDHALLDSESMSKKINMALRDEFPKIAQRRGEDEPDKVPPPDAGSNPKEDEKDFMEEAYEWLENG